MDLLSAMIRGGVRLARSVELAVQWDAILRAGPIHPFTAEDFLLVRGGDLGQFCQVVLGLHRRLSDFLHSVVVRRREVAIRGWRGWLREDPLVHPCKWLRPDLVPPAPFLQCDPALTPVGSGVLSDPMRIDSKKLGFPISVVLDEGRPTLRNSLMRLGAGCLFFLRWSYLGSLVVCLLKWFVRRRLQLVDWMVWGWREFKVLPVSWFDGLARILSCVEDFGVWPDGLLDAYIAMIPKVGGDAAPLGQVGVGRS